MQKGRVRVLIALGCILSLGASLFSIASELRAEDSYASVISEIMLDVEALYKLRRNQMEHRDRQYGMQIRDDDFEDYFPERPINRPLIPTGSSPYPGFIPSNGSAYLLAIDVLFHTLEFYGVGFYFEKTGNAVNFQVISSKDGYFRDLDASTIAFALREFSKYLVAHMCGDPSIQNFYKITTQIPMEKIGMRFKNMMAWALLGNYLPREPNGTIQVGQKWSTIAQVLNSQRSMPPEQTSELRKYIQTISDVVNFLTTFNRTYCFVDIRIKPREEIMNRIVVKKFLNLARDIHLRSEQNRELIESIRRAEQADRNRLLREES